MVMDAFDRWYEEEHRRVLAACSVLAGERETAREATDEAFARALERWSTVSDMAAPGAWVQVVALNHTRRLLRRRRLERLWVMTQRPTPPAEIALPNPELWAAVRALPVRQQTAIILRYVGDLTEDAIAGAMGVSRSTVASTLRDAKLRLRPAAGDNPPAMDTKLPEKEAAP
jgi:RNA polymerase sigma factor (sigma-70 family)